MRKIKLFLIPFLCTVFFISCTNETNELELQLSAPVSTKSTNATISLAADLNVFSLNGTNGIETVGGYYWNQTYSNTKFTTSNFTFSHTANQSWNYWDGFTVSNIADTNNYGVGGSPGNPNNSAGWLPHQWGSMAVPTATTAAPNFLVGYWGYYMHDNQNSISETVIFEENKYATWVKLGNNSQTYTVSKLTVSMHPWPYYGNLNGDGFARKFSQGDHFDLIVYGVKANGKFVTNEDEEIISITYKMADYTGSSLVMPKEWTDVIIDFGQPVKYLVFQMYSTDSHPVYGPNTAVYFCLRDIVMQ